MTEAAGPEEDLYVQSEAQSPEDQYVQSEAQSPDDDYGAAAVSREELTQDSRETLLPPNPARTSGLQAELQVELSAPAYVAADVAALPDAGLVEAVDASSVGGQQEPAWRDDDTAIAPAMEQEVYGQENRGSQVVHSSNDRAEPEDENSSLSGQQVLQENLQEDQGTKGPIPIDKRPAWGGYIVHERTRPRSNRAQAGDGSSASVRQQSHSPGSSRPVLRRPWNNFWAAAKSHRQPQATPRLGGFKDGYGRSPTQQASAASSESGQLLGRQISIL